jgi:starch phosphorylase
LAANHRWIWSDSLRGLWEQLEGGRLTCHPVVLVAEITSEQLADLLEDHEAMAVVTAELAALDAMLGDGLADPQIAYFSPEFGLSDVIPQYSGGLGILAGDHMKAASDLSLPLVGVGLFYRQGFFRQRIEKGKQAEDYPTTDAESLGAVNTGKTVRVPLPGREVVARVWRMDIGRVRLLLLDTDVKSNSAADRKITDRLYSGDRRHRLEQELVLGVGGVRALAAFRWDVSVYHLNEGHAGFLVLELMDRSINGGNLAAAVEQVRPGLVFTTHTPVPAGIDRFGKSLIKPYLQVWADRWSIPIQEIWALGADPVDKDRYFNMAALGLRLASDANGVSKLHGEVSRELFAGVGIGDNITSVTNGVHARTWVSAAAQALFDEVLGEQWTTGDPEPWDRILTLEDSAISDLRHQGARNLSALVSDRTGHMLDPDSLVVGFARRFATYKRATLLFHHMERLTKMLADDERPIHFVFAGKAHPADTPGKKLLAEIAAFAESSPANGRFTFIPDYGIGIARVMYEGCDIWLNTPVRPREASGTSGEKAALNGGLNCSILDGWWAEMFDGRNGWAIPTSDVATPKSRDRHEAAATLDTLEAILAEYHGDRAAFTDRIRHAWHSLGPKVTATRMVAEYRDRIYGPALSRAR